MNFQFKYLIVSVVFITLFSIESFSQCKGFTQKQCMPQLKPYIHNGQMNNIQLFPGQTADLTQTFYSGQEYRILVCNQEVLGDELYFEVFTKDGKLVYTNKEKDNKKIWDFSVASTQNLTIHVTVPENDSPSVAEQTGCVAVMVGFKD
jgi:hypothetical protein